MIIDHIGISVSSYAASKAFYSKSLAPLGIELVTETHGWAGYGSDGKPKFWFGTGMEVQKPMHISFVAQSRAQVRQFHVETLKAGAKDNGVPGIRENYHANYYGVFVIGPDGHNVEAVCHKAEA